MIGASIANRIGIAVTAGILTTVAVLCLILVSAVAAPSAFGAPPPPDEQAAADIEGRIARLVAAGADEAEVRSLVRAANRFARRRQDA